MKTNLLTCALAGLCCASSTPVFAEGDGWTFAPFRDDGWEPKFTLALTAGYMDVDNSDANGDLVPGAQVSLDCPWFAPPKGTIRQQFNYNYYHDGDLKIRSYEINPRYYLDINPSTRVGFGPGFGYVVADQDGGEHKGMWSYQLGADVEYRDDGLFYGFGVRYQGTEKETLGPDDEGADNWLAQFKVGVNF